MNEKIKKVLTIAGSDCSGGAGIQTDLKTIYAHGMYGMSAITALTVQNTYGVQKVSIVEESLLLEQLEAVFSDIMPDAVKIGMLPTKNSVHLTAKMIKKYHPQFTVLDPVMVSTSGKILMLEEARQAAVEELFPELTLITPNIPEAEVLSGMNITDDKSAKAAADIIKNKIPGDRKPAVLIKGGHAEHKADDLLFVGETMVCFRGERIDAADTHGTGCVLSSAIACNLAKGETLENSVKHAKIFLTELLLQHKKVGHGNGPVFVC